MSDINRLVDNGFAVIVFKNTLGSYTSLAVRPDNDDLTNIVEDADEDSHLTDDFTVDAALNRLADKVLKCGDYQSDGGVT